MTTITTNMTEPKQPPPSSSTSTSTTQLIQPSSSSRQKRVSQQVRSKPTRGKTIISTNSNSSRAKNLASLGRFYVNTMKTIGTKQVLRMDPSIKRTISKRCESILLPGVTSRIRIKCKSLSQKPKRSFIQITHFILNECLNL